jgi:predicted GH43/DUF377 family glycosyl hydrolase
VGRVLALSDEQVTALLSELLVRFSDRHCDLEKIFESNAEHVSTFYDGPISKERVLLLGATFTHEYSIEGASVCNPGLVPHPDQSDVPECGLRVILSYRAIGEGHISSICFRTGEIDSAGTLIIDASALFPVVGEISDAALVRGVFEAKLRDTGLEGETANAVLDMLDPIFSPAELDEAIVKIEEQIHTRSHVKEVVELLCAVAGCCYLASFDGDTAVSQRVLWPVTTFESHGMEDARFVWLADEQRYVATYTAYDGEKVSQQLLQTRDFITFASSPLSGLGAHNKGMAIFPRKINGRYVSLSRHDRESNAVAFSEDLYGWDNVETIQIPKFPWETIQLGNCGSPIELDEGWLMLTHGVGAMRTYTLGALLLDLDDPTKIIGQLDAPLLIPEIAERDGYVPNVVYSCGSLAHDGTLHIPYGASDQSISFASVDIKELLSAFK